MIKTLKTKQGSEWTNDEGQTFPAATLYRFEDENGQGGCWYSTLGRAETSWTRWIAGAPLRAKRRAEVRELRERVALAQSARYEAADPFAVFD